MDEMDIDMQDIEDYLENTKQMEKEKPKEPEKKAFERKDLKAYYEVAFPFEQMFTWLGLEKPDYFERREICFTLENDAYIRFQCYSSAEEYKKEVLRGMPFKIDIGAVYNTLPKYHKSIQANDTKGFYPEQKDLIFDIDMTDYDDVRTCCKDAQICNKCWCYMIIAYKILNSILREDFGFKHIMWVFSGRRGIHCWVSDKRARALNNDGRSAIVNYIKIRLNNANTGGNVNLKEPLHPSLE
jgi:DNA primase small subunit